MKGLLYEPDFISREEEKALLESIAALPLKEAKHKGCTARRRWRRQHSVAPTRELRYSITFRTRRAKR